MADKDFKVKNGIDVAGNANIDGNLNAAKYQTSAPSSPVTGQLWIDSDASAGVLNQNDYLLKADFEVLSTPIGGVTQYAGATTPSANWAICDGSEISRATYETLFTRIGTSYGVGDGSTTFNLPNLKGKVLVGLDSTQTEFDALGETGGAKTHTLTSTEIPGHTHTTNIGHGHLDTLAAPAHTHNIGHGHADTLAAPAHTHSIDPPNTSTDPDTHYHTVDTYLSDSGSGISTIPRVNVAVGDRSLNNTAGDTNTDSHSHSINIAAFTSGGASATGLSGTVTDLPTTASGAASATTLSGSVTDLATTDVTSSTGSGGGGAHNNLQPYIVMNYLIRIA